MINKIKLWWYLFNFRIECSRYTEEINYRYGGDWYFDKKEGCFYDIFTDRICTLNSIKEEGTDLSYYWERINGS